MGKYVEAEKLFQDLHDTTKEDVLNTIAEYEEAINESSQEDMHHSSAFYSTVKRLLQLFRDRINHSVLFNSLEPGWSYECNVGYWGIELNIVHSIIHGLNGMGGVDCEIDQTYTLIRVDCKLLTPDEYGERYHIDPGTVRQWIRRAKVRTAVKNGGEWRIPELTEQPRRGYSTASFRWEGELSYIPDEYKFLKDYKSILFKQDENDKSKFVASLFGDGDFIPSKRIELNTSQREKLEIFCIGHPQIQYIPTIDDGIFYDLKNMKNAALVKSKHTYKK